MKTAAWLVVALVLASCSGNSDGPTASGDMGGARATGGSSATGGSNAGNNATAAGGASTTGGATGTGGAGPSGGSNAGGALSGSGGGGASGGSNLDGSTTATPDSGGPPVVPDETLCGDVQLATPKGVPANTITAICPGATVTVASGTWIVVYGTLLVQGTQAAPVKLSGAQHTPGYWTGIILGSGGKLAGTYAEVHDATTGVDARIGSSYDIDHILIDNSSQPLGLAASGTISHGTLHGLLANQPGSMVAVNSASPRIVDTLVDRGYYGVVDSIVVNGAASTPVFDHMEVADTHCAFHFNSATGATITHSYVHHNVYGLMVYASTGGQILHNNFQDNTVNIGSCNPGAAGNVSDNYFAGLPLDSSCLGLTLSGVAAGPYTTDVGPRP